MRFAAGGLWLIYPGRGLGCGLKNVTETLVIITLSTTAVVYTKCEEIKQIKWATVKTKPFHACNQQHFMLCTSPSLCHWWRRYAEREGDRSAPNDIILIIIIVIIIMESLRLDL